MDVLFQDDTKVVTTSPAPRLPNSMTTFQGTIIILLICLGLGLLGWFVFEVSAGFDSRLQAGIERLDKVNEKINAPVQWEYRIESLPDRSFDQRINAMGRDGWELVFARRASDGSDYSPTFSYEMIFKRPKKTERDPSEKQKEKASSTEK